MRRASQPAAWDLDAELARIATLTIDQLRDEWREFLGVDPPPALTKDLIARVLSYRLQEKVLGGLGQRLCKALDAIGKGNQAPVQRIKVGSVLVREHDGQLHEVYVAPDGFSWQSQTYASLSTIARKITGTNWNGPRFFGLRENRSDPTETATAALAPNPRKFGSQSHSSIRPHPSKAFIKGNL